MSLKARLGDDMKQALRAGDKHRLSTLRMTLAAIQQREVDERIELDDPQVLSVIEKMIKQRRESAVQYRAGDREELAQREEAEIGFLDDYLPEPMSEADLDALVSAYADNDYIGGCPLVVVVDDSQFATDSLDNFLWVTFTRSNPAKDMHGVGSFVLDKHWGCRGSLVIDARIKPHHAPPLIEDPEITRRVDQLGARGGPLYGVI